MAYSTVSGDDAACAAARQGGTGLARAARRRCGAAAAAQGGKQPAGCGHRARPAPLSRPATALPDARGRTARRTRLVLWRRSLRATRCHRPPSAARATSARGSWRRPHCCRRQHLCSQRRGGRSGCGDRSVGCLARGCSLSPAAVLAPAPHLPAPRLPAPRHPAPSAICRARRLPRDTLDSPLPRPWRWPRPRQQPRRRAAAYRAAARGRAAAGRVRPLTERASARRPLDTASRCAASCAAPCTASCVASCTASCAAML